jgi:peptidoglycan DL-endopeptidase CwlO
VTSTSTRRIALRLFAVGVAVVALTAVFTASAFADQISDAKARAAKVQAQVDALNTNAETASEEYNNARDHFATVSAQAASSAKTLKKVTKQRDALQSQLDGRATSLYRQGPLGWMNVLLSARNFSDFDVAYQMLTNMSRRDAATVSKLKAAKDHADKVHADLVAQQKEAAKQKRAMASNKAAVESKLGQAKQVLAQADTEVKTLIAAQKAAEEAAARRAAAEALAAARAERASSSSSGGGSGDISSADYGNPPASGLGAKAVWYAMKKIGCPYVWAADGPNTFDCSGLTMWAYAQVGIHLNHYSRDQINEGKRVAKSNLQPGDLVFFGSPIHHVAMYVGGGKMIEAPYSGADVRISSLNRRHDYAGACRPGN